eukprot:1156493-Pelagomonas_calceolata.AAC.3
MLYALKPMFILCHLQHAARTVRLNDSSRLHAAIIEFKQAYDTIPREALRVVLDETGPFYFSQPRSEDVPLMYADDEYVLKDGAKTARVRPMQGVKQGLDVYAKKEHDINNTVKSEAVHFNSIGNHLPVFTIGSDTLAHKDSFKYLVVMFYRTLNMAKLTENASRGMLTSAYRIRRFVHEHTLADRPHASLWLAKTYVFAAGMYAIQVWGTGFMQAGKEISSALQALHLNFLKGTLGMKRTTTNRAVLRECGIQPLQYKGFRAAVKLCNSTLRRVTQADLKLQSKDDKCWTAQLVQVF